MPKYRVTFAKTITCVVDVEADDETAAIDQAYNDAPHSLCAQCGGWGQRWGVNDDAEWETLDEFHGENYDPERYGATVEPA